MCYEKRVFSIPPYTISLDVLVDVIYLPRFVGVKPTRVPVTYFHLGNSRKRILMKKYTADGEVESNACQEGKRTDIANAQ